MIVWAVSPVPVPDIGPMPEQYTTSVSVYVLGGLGIVGILLFVGSVLTAGRRTTSVRAVWAPVVVPLVMMVVGVLGATGLRAWQDHQRDEEQFAHYRLEDELRPGVQADLEAAYDITIEQQRYIPITPGDVGSLDIVTADGTALECELYAEGVYRFMCGEDVIRSELTELPLAG